jgi:hypothetical protein
MKTKASLWMGLAALLAVWQVTAASRGLREQTEIAIQVSPSVVSMVSQGTAVTVHTNLPYGTVETVGIELNGLPVEACFADSLGYLVCKFDLDAVKSIIAPPQATLVMSGQLKSGAAFSAADVVGVVD